MIAETDDTEQLFEARGFPLALAPEQSGCRAARTGACKHQVVVNSVIRAHGRLLEFPADAERRYSGFVDFRQVDRTALEQYVAGVRPRLSGNYVHHRGLAGAIGADDRAHLARLDH